jgi:hypothetical protein
LLPGVRNQIRFFPFYHFLFEPMFQTLIVNVPYWAVTSTGVQKRISLSAMVLPADFTLDFRLCLWIYYSTIYFNCFFLKFFLKWRHRTVVMKIALIVLSFLWRLLNLISMITAFVIFDVEFYSTKFDDISTIKLVIKVVLGRFSVSYNHKHFIVDILIWNRISLFISWSFCNKSIILYLKLSFLLFDNDHRLCILVDLLRFCPDRNEFDIIIDSQYLSTSLCLDILFGNILWLIVK